MTDANSPSWAGTYYGPPTVLPTCDNCGRVVVPEVDGYWRHADTGDTHCLDLPDHGTCASDTCGPWAEVNGSAEYWFEPTEQS